MTEIVQPAPGLLTEWDAMMAEATIIDTPELVKDDEYDSLTGVPLIITEMTFRRGISRQGKASHSKQHPYDAYVSCEALISPDLNLHRINAKRAASSFPLAPLAKPPFDPGSLVVFNDSSTGTYRQCVAYLAHKGYITLPDGLPVEGKLGKGESALDLAPYEWQRISSGDAVTDEEGFLVATFTTRLAARNGIRISSYDWDGKLAKTRYLA